MSIIDYVEELIDANIKIRRQHWHYKNIQNDFIIEVILVKKTQDNIRVYYGQRDCVVKIIYSS